MSKVEDAKALRDVKEAVTSLDTLSKLGENAGQEGMAAAEATEGVAQMSSTLSKLGTLGAGLGVAGAVFSLIAAFEPSSTDVILKELGKLDDKLTSLESRLSDKLDSMLAKILEGQIDNTLAPAFAKVEALNSSAVAYRNGVVQQSDADVTTAKTALKLIDLGDIQTQLRLIADLATGANNLDAFSAVYVESLGAAAEINTLGDRLWTHVLTSYVNVSLAAAVQELPGAAGLGPQYAKQPATDVLTAWIAALKKCHKDTNVHQNIADRITNKFVTSAANDGYPTLDKQAASNQLLKRLKKDFPWLDIAVIIYYGVTGRGNHRTIGTKNYYTGQFRNKGSDGHLCNIVVYWNEKFESLTPLADIAGEVKTALKWLDVTEYENKFTETDGMDSRAKPMYSVELKRASYVSDPYLKKRFPAQRGLWTMRYLDGDSKENDTARVDAKMNPITSKWHVPGISTEGPANTDEDGPEEIRFVVQRAKGYAYVVMF